MSFIPSYRTNFFSNNTAQYYSNAHLKSLAMAILLMSVLLSAVYGNKYKMIQLIYMYIDGSISNLDFISNRRIIEF